VADEELIPQEHGGALRKNGGNPENLQKGRADRVALRERVAREPDAALEEIHKDLTSLARKILRRAERSGQVPPRATMEVVKEFRQTQEAVNEARKSRGALAEADEILAEMDTKIQEATERMGTDPVPAVVPPA
jgi:hypothetical protein